MYFLGRSETILPKRISIPFQRRGFYPRGLPTTGLNLPVYLRQVFLPNGFLLSNADSSLFAASIFSFFRSFATLIDRSTRTSQEVAGYQARDVPFCKLPWSSEDLFVRNSPTTDEINSDCRKSHLDRGIARVICQSLPVTARRSVAACFAFGGISPLARVSTPTLRWPFYHETKWSLGPETLATDRSAVKTNRAP